MMKCLTGDIISTVSFASPNFGQRIDGVGLLYVDFSNFTIGLGLSLVKCFLKGGYQVFAGLYRFAVDLNPLVVE